MSPGKVVDRYMYSLSSSAMSPMATISMMKPSKALPLLGSQASKSKPHEQEMSRICAECIRFMPLKSSVRPEKSSSSFAVGMFPFDMSKLQRPEQANSTQILLIWIIDFVAP